MAAGLGMTPAEWDDLRAQVDDSFWVLRVIGPRLFTNVPLGCLLVTCANPGYPPLPNDRDGFSCGAHK